MINANFTSLANFFYAQVIEVKFRCVIYFLRLYFEIEGEGEGEGEGETRVSAIWVLHKKGSSLALFVYSLHLKW